MGAKGSGLERTDLLIWVGMEALQIWNRKREEEKGIPFLQEKNQKIPYVPKFHCLWEDPVHYSKELRRAIGRGRFRVLLAMPEDITFIESTALKDFIYQAMGGRLKRFHGLTACPQSVLLGPYGEHYIAATRTCRCYCLAEVKNGEIVDSQLLDAYQSDRNSLDWAVRDLSAKNSGIPVYYPESEEDWALMGIGENVPFSQIATMDKPQKKKKPDSRK